MPVSAVCVENFKFILFITHALKRMALNIALDCRRAADMGPMIEI